MAKKLEALFNAVIVKPIEVEEQLHGNIIVPDIDKQTNIVGEIVAVGPGTHSVTGDFLPTVSKIGDVVILPSMGFSKFDFDGTTYNIGRENELLGKIVEVE